MKKEKHPLYAALMVFFLLLLALGVWLLVRGMQLGPWGGMKLFGGQSV